MSVDVISAIFGGYETPKAPVPQDGIDVGRWILVTDDPNLDAPGWDVVVERRPHVHPNVAAKVPKFLPHLYSDAQYTVWIDGHALIQPTLIAHCVETLKSRPWTHTSAFPHPQRVRLMDEVKASRGLPKYDELDLEGQVKHYLRNGYMDRTLWATGCIARRMWSDDGTGSGMVHWTSQVHNKVGQAWLAEVVRWGFQDQLSFPYVLEKMMVLVDPLGPDLWNTPHIWWANHG